jgi:hypothetical protein
MASLIAFCVLIRSITPPPYVHIVSEKLAYLVENPDRYDVLMVGSSRVYRQISPAAFDRVLAEAGYPMRSFNLGIGAAKVAEVSFLLKRLEREQVTRPRYILVDPDGLYASIAEVNTNRQREIYWHEAPETRLALQSLAEDDAMTRLSQGQRHVRAHLFNRFGYGRLRGYLAGLLRSDADHRRILGRRGDGFVPYTVEGAERFERERRRFFLDNLDRYRRGVARQQRQLTRPGRLRPHHRAMFEHLNLVIEATGAEPIFILAPVTSSRGEARKAHRRGILPVLLPFDDPGLYPQLYEVGNRFDMTHLNRQGAVLYSELLAREFAQHLRRSGVRAN